MPECGIIVTGWRHAILRSGLLAILLITSGCATTSFFSPYPLQIADIKTQLEAKQFTSSLTTLDKQRNSEDKTLYLLERARVAQLAGEIDVSIADFKAAIQNEVSADERAKLSLSESAAKSASLVSSDNVIPYHATSYERVMMYHYQAMNYLAQNNFEAAGVEIRRAALEQKQALERYDREIAEAEQKARQENYRPSMNQSQVDQQFREMYAAAGDIKNSFQNAYTFYFSGIVWEMLGEDNDAYIDYKKALEIHPDNHFLQKDVLRLALKLGFDDEYNIFNKKFGTEGVLPRMGEGEIVILYEEGYIPVKEEAMVHLPVRSALHSVAFPFYRDTTRSLGHLKISSANKTLGNSELIVDLRALAIKDLQEKMPAIMIRQVLRLLAKDRLQQTAKDQLGGAGQVFALIYNVISERADRRSWLTLPRNVQIYRTRLPAGDQKLEFYSSKNFQTAKMGVNIRENQITVVHVVGTDRQLIAREL